jgi:hypothetical protein
MWWKCVSILFWTQLRIRIKMAFGINFRNPILVRQDLHFAQAVIEVMQFVQTGKWHYYILHEKLNIVEEAYMFPWNVKPNIF